MKKIGVILLLAALVWAVSGWAETEISGEVSGVWTSDDSPYIVVDST